MDNIRRKTLMAQYRQSRTEMGVFAFRCTPRNLVYLGVSQNVPGAINSIRFQLQNNAFPTNRKLLTDWLQFGPDGFTVETLETLDYDKEDESKTDYSEDLAILKEFWREQLMRDGIVVENVKPKDR